MFVESVYYWVDKYVNERESVSLPENQASETMAKKNPEDRIKELEAENSRLEKALELEKFRSKAYLRKNGLMVHIRRRRHYKTTDSNHHYRKYPNLIAELVPSRPNEVWVSDITYVETGGGAHAVRDAAQMLEKRMGGDVE